IIRTQTFKYQLCIAPEVFSGGDLSVYYDMIKSLKERRREDHNALAQTIRHLERFSRELASSDEGPTRDLYLKLIGHCHAFWKLEIFLSHLFYLPDVLNFDHYAFLQKKADIVSGSD
ncbi:MAG: hypothetical protein Q9226_004979, partial [Calogaya cf. arnoldii]